MSFEFTAAPKKIPAVIITGFLGAGKTTLVRNLLMKAKDKRIALIVNEFGEMGFDGSLVNGCADPECAADEVVELANGCICCTVADDFLPTMEMLLERKPAPDVIVIETSGLALPQPLVRAFNWPSVKPRVTVDSVVTVVDAPAVAVGKVASDEEAVAAQRAADEALDHESPIEELFTDQLTCADLVVLSKADLLDEAGLAAVRASIGARLRDGVEIVAASHGELALDVLLGRDCGAEDDMALRSAHHETQHAHDHDHHHEHSHDDFESIVLPVRSFASLEEAKLQVEAAMKISGILRIKGSVVVEGKSAPVLVQAVGPRVEAWFATGSESHSKLVVIGLAGFDQGAAQAVLGVTETV